MTIVTDSGGLEAEAGEKEGEGAGGGGEKSGTRGGTPGIQREPSNMNHLPLCAPSIHQRFRVSWNRSLLISRRKSSSVMVPLLNRAFSSAQRRSMSEVVIGLAFLVENIHNERLSNIEFYSDCGFFLLA